MVARSLSSEYRFNDLEESYGVALTLITHTGELASLSLALGGERTRVRFTFGAGL